jgi:hypothetical protein
MDGPDTATERLIDSLRSKYSSVDAGGGAVGAKLSDTQIARAAYQADIRRARQAFRRFQRRYMHLQPTCERHRNVIALRDRFDHWLAVKCGQLFRTPAALEWFSKLDISDQIAMYVLHRESVLSGRRLIIVQQNIAREARPDRTLNGRRVPRSLTPGHFSEN